MTSNFSLSGILKFANRTAFTLVEMLVVIAIIALLGTLGVIAFKQILESSRMELAGRIIVDEINLARQVAASRNRNTEVRFIKKARDGGDAVFYRVQTGWLDKDGTFQPIAPEAKFPEGMILSPSAGRSSLIGLLSEKISTNPVYNYKALIIRPSGFIEPQNGIALDAPWFVTVLRARDEAKSDDGINDFITVQIDPWTSRSTIYRP